MDFELKIIKQQQSVVDWLSILATQSQNAFVNLFIFNYINVNVLGK